MFRIILFVTLLFIAAPAHAEDLKTKLANDHVLGQDNAPITVIEYASLSCPHCADFHNKILPSIKKDFIDSGKVRLIFRSFPLNGSALLGSQLALCAGKDGDAKYYDVLDVLFSQQNDWAFADNFQAKALEILVAKGFDRTILEACVNDKTFDNQIVDTMRGGQGLGVKATPSFFINGEATNQLHSAEKAAGIFNALLAGKSPEEGLKEAAKSVLEARPDDMVLGQDQAKVTVIEYINIGCPHCASTHKVIVDALNTDYIDTGKAKLVFREFPMDASGFYAYMAAHCKGKGEFFNTLSFLIDEWKHQEGTPAFITSLRVAMEKAGISKEVFYACLENQDVENRISANIAEAHEDLGIQRSPAVYVNGQPLQDFSPAGVRSAVDAVLAR